MKKTVYVYVDRNYEDIFGVHVYTDLNKAILSAYDGYTKWCKMMKRTPRVFEVFESDVKSKIDRYGDSEDIYVSEIID